MSLSLTLSLPPSLISYLLSSRHRSLASAAAEGYDNLSHSLNKPGYESSGSFTRKAVLMTFHTLFKLWQRIVLRMFEVQFL